MRTPGSFPASTHARSRSVVLDIFAPPREEYRQAGSGLGDATLAR
jgi:hypothetical protein